MKRLMLWVMAAILTVCGASVFTACTNNDNPVDPGTPINNDVRLTQIYSEVFSPLTGGLLSSTTMDLFWENGLLKKQTSISYVSLVNQSTLLGVETYVYNGNDCIEMHFSSLSLNTDTYFTYADGRLVSAIKWNGNDIEDKVTIHSYTNDGYVKTMTIENVALGKTFDCELTWKDGDLTSYRKHPVDGDGEDEIYNATFDDYPNVHTGKPLADCIFDPGSMVVRASKHNLMTADTEYTYDNGRLVSEKSGKKVFYYTYSDGTTGKK